MQIKGLVTICSVNIFGCIVMLTIIFSTNNTFNMTLKAIIQISLK